MNRKQNHKEPRASTCCVAVCDLWEIKRRKSKVEPPVEQQMTVS